MTTIAEQIEIPTPPHRSCTQLDVGGLLDDTLHRFVLGLDEKPVRLTPEETSQQLHDVVALSVLRSTPFPRTAGEFLEVLSAAVDAGDPLAARQFFIVGEGGQIPRMEATPVPRNLRFLATTGSGPQGPDVMVSAFHPDAGVVEVMAWDHEMGGFNFYRTMSNSSAWVFAGNSRHALTEPTRRHGPFESHVNGHLLMKELRFPWVNWHSPVANIVPSVLADQGLDQHPWVRQLEPGGAYTLEDNVVKPAVERWTRARIAAMTARRAEEGPRRILEQVLTTLTVNLISSRTSSAAAVTGAANAVDLPETFFVDAAALARLGLTPPPAFTVAAETYASAMEELDAHLEARSADGSVIFSSPGDTHFAFVVPERAHEDVETMRQALEAGIVTRRLLACLLMVDFENPIFSPARTALLSHIPEGQFAGDGVDFSQAVADSILASPQVDVPDSPEAAFASHWGLGEDFDASFNARLTAYYAAVGDRLTTPIGFSDYFRLAESRRAEVEEMPIAESPLLFAKTNVGAANRHMTPLGTVEEQA